MEKYATYKVYKNIKTGEIKRVPLTSEMDKQAEVTQSADFKELDQDPQDQKHV